MDTSKINIKMCEKATGVQTSWEPEEGDYAVYKGGLKSGVVILVAHLQPSGVGDFMLPEYTEITTNFNRVFSARPSKYIWMPRQDQLWKFVDKDDSCLSRMGVFARWCEDPWGFGSMPFPKQLELLTQWSEYIDIFTTIEQLLLAYVEHTKFNKVWNGEDWEKA